MDLDVDISLADAVLALNVVAAALWLGGLAMADLLGARLRERADAASIVSFIADYGRITLAVLVPAAVVTAASALWIAQDAGRTLDDDWWLPASAALWFVGVVGSLALRPLAARRVEQFAAQHGADHEEVQWRARRVLLLARGELLLLTVAMVLQTIKPG